MSIKNITKKQLKFFENKGFLLINNVLKKNDFLLINKTLSLLEKKQPNGRGTSEPGVDKSLIHSIHKEKELILSIEKNEWFQNISKKILKTNSVSVWNAKSNLKRRWNGAVEYFHQDYIYWKELGFQSSQMINCMIFVDNHSHLNGGLWIFPGSHKKNYKHTSFLNINSLHKYFIHPRELDKISLKFKPTSISANKGSCLFFHSKLIHGSSHNISSKDRRILLYDISTTAHFIKANKKKINTFNREQRKKFEKKILTDRLSSLS